MMQVTGVTLWEDANHPESWLRDATLDYWDVPSQSWKTGPALLSDAATTPMPSIPRCKVRGCASPCRRTARSTRGWAKWCWKAPGWAARTRMYWPGITPARFSTKTPTPSSGTPGGGGWNVQYSDAYSGAACLAKTDTNWSPRVGQLQSVLLSTPGLEYADRPAPQNANEFRYLQFAWKAVEAPRHRHHAGDRKMSTAATQPGQPVLRYLVRDDDVSVSGAGPAADLHHRTHQLDTGDRRSLAALPEICRQPADITFIDFGSAGGSGNVEFDAIKLYKTDPLGTGFTPPTVNIFATDQQTYSAPAGIVMTSQASDAMPAAASARWNSTMAPYCWYRDRQSV